MAAPNIEGTSNPDVSSGGVFGVKVGNRSDETIGFYGAVGSTLQTGVAQTPEAIHAALVALGLITA